MQKRRLPAITMNTHQILWLKDEYQDSAFHSVYVKFTVNNFVGQKITMGYNPSFAAPTGFINVNLKCRIHLSEQCVIGKNSDLILKRGNLIQVLQVTSTT